MMMAGALVALLSAAAVDFTGYDALLRAHVSGRGVDYAGLEKQRPELRAVRDQVAAARGAQPLSFYLNAYNALVLWSVVDVAQPASVLAVKGFFDARRHVVAGEPLTLNELEGRIRERFRDPRIHFALNCAARSCPPLWPQAFQERTLSQDLDLLTRRFLDGPGVLPDGEGAVKVSRLFEWYAQDFAAQEGSVEGYLRKWVREPSRRKALEGPRVTVRFQEYDWALNAAR